MNAAVRRLCILLLPVACVVPVEPPPDGADAAIMTPDAAVMDAGSAPDASIPDATLPPDAGVDAGGSVAGCCARLGCQDRASVEECLGYATEPCVVDGQDGVCVDVSWCGGGFAHAPGDCSVGTECCHRGRDGGVPDAAIPDAGGSTSFEACCAEEGCADNASVEQCSALEPMYGRCSVQGQPGVCVDTGWCGGAWFPTPGHCPGPANIQCCRPPPIDGGAFMCTGTERPLPNEGIVETSLDPSCPAGMIPVGGMFCVDAYEGFLTELLPDGGSAPWSPYFNPGSRMMRAHSAAGAVPQGYINADQAEQACNNAGKRLCTDQEWLRACRGPSGTTYPYGNTRMDGTCNDARAMHPAIEYFGADDPDPFSKIQHACLNQLPDGLDTTGANSGCVTAEGAFDMMGNLHEWTSAAAGTFRGGFYVDTRINGEGCLYATTAHTRPHWDYSTGFRCCAEVLGP